MASAAEPPSSSPNTTHTERTSTDPRAPIKYTAAITSIRAATPSVRLIDFKVSPAGTSFRFKAGQWVDTYTPASEQAGGFTIVSTPARGLLHGEFQLAIQKADRNPPAAYFWSLPLSGEKVEPTPAAAPTEAGTPAGEVTVQVGGQFHFPPVNFRRLGQRVRKVTLIAGGVGINPLLSILGALRDSNVALDVELLYGVRSPAEALFLDEIRAIGRDLQATFRSTLFVSKPSDTAATADGTDAREKIIPRRMDESDLKATIEPEAEGNLYYICGPAQMTDWAQDTLLKLGVPKDFCQTERWW